MLGILLIAYLFVGGAAAGLCLVLSLVSLKVKTPVQSLEFDDHNRHIHGCHAYNGYSHNRNASGRHTYNHNTGNWHAHNQNTHAAQVDAIKRGYSLCVVLLVVAGLLLMADLGRLDRLELLLFSPTASLISVGAYALLITLVLTGIQWLRWHRVFTLPAAIAKVVTVVLVVSSAVVMVYTGLLLGDISAIPLWANPVLPVLFFVSSLSCGLALAAILAGFSRGFSQLAQPLARLVEFDVVVKFTEVIVCVAFVVVGFQLGSSAANPTEETINVALQTLLTGPDAGLLFGGFIMLGLVLPLIFDIVLLFNMRPAPLLAVVSAGCVLFGGFVVRYCIVSAGVNVAFSLVGFGG